MTDMYECKTCGKKFENERNLSVHMRFGDTECRIHEIVYGSTDVGASSAIDGEGINMDDVNDQTPPLFGDDAIIDGLLAWEHTPPVLD